MSHEPSDDDTPPLRELLPLASEAGAYQLPAEHVAALIEAATELGLSLRRIDLSGCSDAATLLLRLSQALGFPAWFGNNWDALIDCLRDLSWLGEAGGYVLLLEGAQDLQRAAPDDFDLLIQVLDEVAEDWRETGLPFWAFFSEPAQR